MGFAACALIIFGILNGRRQRLRFKFPLRPVWAEVFLAALGMPCRSWRNLVMNSYPWPQVIENYAGEHATSRLTKAAPFHGGELSARGADSLHTAMQFPF